MSRAPWEMLLPDLSQLDVIQIGGDVSFLPITATDKDMRSQVSNLPRLIVRGPGGPEFFDTVSSIRNLDDASDDWLLWVSRKPVTPGKIRIGDFLAKAGGKYLTLQVGSHSIWSAGAYWAAPLRGAGKLQLVREIMERLLPFLSTFLSDKTEYYLLSARMSACAPLSWIEEALVIFEDLGVEGIRASTMGRLDITSNGAAIGQFRKPDGSRWGLKVALNDIVAGNLSRESAAVKKLRHRLDANNNLAKTIPTESFSATVRQRHCRIDKWIFGDSAVRLMYTSIPRESVVDAAINWIGELHKTTARGSLDSADQARLAASVLTDFQAVSAIDDKQFICRIAKYLESRITGSQITTVFGHGDFWLGNVMFEPDTLAVTGVIDWDFCDEAAPPLEDVLHLLCHRKSIFSVYDPGRHISVLLEGRSSEEDLQRIRRYMSLLDLDRRSIGTLVILYWIRYLSSRQSTLSTRNGWHDRSFIRVRKALKSLSDSQLDELGDQFAGHG